MTEAVPSGEKPGKRGTLCRDRAGVRRSTAAGLTFCLVFFAMGLTAVSNTYAEPGSSGGPGADWAAQLQAAGSPADNGGWPADPQGVDDVARVSLTADVARIVPGRTFHLAVQFDLAPHWHTYWENSGASGSASEFTVTAPDGFTVGSPIHPRPKQFDQPEGAVFGFEDQAMVFLPITAPATVSPGSTQAFRVDVYYLVCDEICMIGTTQVDLALPIAGPGEDAGDVPPGVARHTRRLPLTPRTTRATVKDSTLTVEGVLPAAFAGKSAKVIAPAFFPVERSGVRYGEPVITIDADAKHYRVSVPLELSPQNTDEEQFNVRGLVTFGNRPDDPSHLVSIFMPTHTTR